MEIIKSLSRRYGFEGGGMRALGYGLKPFFGCRCKVPKYIASLEEPVVFVCNHYELFGPLSIVLSLPLKYRLWSNYNVVNASENMDKLVIGFRHTFPFLSEKGARRMLKLVSPAVEKVMAPFEPIPVYREDLGKQRRTLQQSVDAMISGDNIVLFPENALPAYSKGRVTEFFRSFVLIGEYYRRKTGKDALFCPIYVDKKHHRLRFGDLVRYGTAKAVDECERISNELRSQLLSMADEALGPALLPAGGEAIS